MSERMRPFIKTRGTTMTIRPQRYARYRRDGEGSGSYAKTYRRAQREGSAGASPKAAKPTFVDVVTADFAADRRREPA
jgi:hypothetical protein